MADVIHIRRGVASESNLIVQKPLEMRWIDWESGSPIQVSRRESERFERERERSLREDGSIPPGIPNHYSLKNGPEITLWALYCRRNDPDAMREVYYLAGLMECMTHVPHPVLRTVMVRGFYRTLQELQERLGVFWRGRIHHFLFPTAAEHGTSGDFVQSLQSAETLRDLFITIREQTEEQFLVLGSEYVFYLPRITHCCGPGCC